MILPFRSAGWRDNLIDIRTCQRRSFWDVQHRRLKGSTPLRMKTKLAVISSLSRPVAACVLMTGAGLVCAALLLAGANVHAANVGPGGYTNAFSTAAPAAADWSTLPVAGSSGTIVDAAGLNATVQASAASSITTALGNGVSVPPAPSTGGAVWTSDGLLQTRPTTVACTLLVAFVPLVLTKVAKIGRAHV